MLFSVKISSGVYIHSNITKSELMMLTNRRKNSLKKKHVKYKYLEIERTGDIDLDRDLDTDRRDLSLGDTLQIIVH